jgi:hypothetical protein
MIGRVFASLGYAATPTHRRHDPESGGVWLGVKSDPNVSDGRLLSAVPSRRVGSATLGANLNRAELGDADLGVNLRAHPRNLDS